MLVFLSVLSAFLLMFLVLKFQGLTKTAKALPDGPKGLPVIGNLLQFVNNPHLKLSEWAKQYGKMYTVYIGSQPVLVINDVKTIKELFGTMESTGMFQSEILRLLYEGPWGLLNSEGQLWHEQRRFCVKAMKEQGFGNGITLDPVILNEIDELCGLIDDKLTTGGKHTVRLNKMLMRATGNTMWNIITGDKLKSGDLQVFHLLEQWVKTLNVATVRGLAFVPWLKYVMPDTCGYTAYSKTCQDIRHLVKTYFSKHLESRKNKQELVTSASTSLITAYLNQIEECDAGLQNLPDVLRALTWPWCDDPNSSFYGKRGMKHGLGSVIALLLAGTETTASTLTWLIYYLIVYPNVQEKLQKEIDSVIGQNRDPTITDKSRMPYTDAVITETLRFSSLGPFGVVHRLICDVSFEGFKLPEGMFLMANLYHVHYNLAVWTKPEIFSPERFLEGDHSTRKGLKENVIPFQEGKRKCPGEQLAKDTLFLFTTKLFKKYSFGSAKDVNIQEYIKPVRGMLLAPPDLGVVVKDRC